MNTEFTGDFYFDFYRMSILKDYVNNLGSEKKLKQWANSNSRFIPIVQKLFLESIKKQFTSLPKDLYEFPVGFFCFLGKLEEILQNIVYF